MCKAAHRVKSLRFKFAKNRRQGQLWVKPLADGTVVAVCMCARVCVSTRTCVWGGGGGVGWGYGVCSETCGTLYV